MRTGFAGAGLLVLVVLASGCARTSLDLTGPDGTRARYASTKNVQCRVVRTAAGDLQVDLVGDAASVNQVNGSVAADVAAEAARAGVQAALAGATGGVAGGGGK